MMNKKVITLLVFLSYYLSLVSCSQAQSLTAVLLVAVV